MYGLEPCRLYVVLGVIHNATTNWRRAFLVVLKWKQNLAENDFRIDYLRPLYRDGRLRTTGAASSAAGLSVSRSE